MKRLFRTIFYSLVGLIFSRGLQTGAVIYASDGSKSMSALYYDLKGNVIENREITNFGTLRVSTNSYTYTGQPLRSTISENGVSMLTTNGYDASSGLLTYTDISLNGANQRVSAVTYDGLGRIASVARGNSSKGGTVKYAYNLHGQTTSIYGPGFTQALHYADGPGTKCYNGSVSAMTWTTGSDATLRGYRYAYNGYNWLTSADYGEGASLSDRKDRYTEKSLEFMLNGGIRRLQRHGLKADGIYGKVDNLHIYYDGNRISGVLEDADPVTQNGSMDYPGKNREMAFTYNEWGALTQDESRVIADIRYDCLGNPVGISYDNGSSTENIYSASGEKLKATHTTVSGGLTAKSIIEYRGPVIYKDGAVDMILFPGGYATVSGGVTFHYYTQDYLGNNRAVINGTTGAIEQTISYYPYGGIIPELSTNSSTQPFKFGGKELMTANGLNEYDFGARQYYQAVPHFTRIDPMCEKYPWISPYLYCANNPVNLVDRDGRDVNVYATELPGQPLGLRWATHTFITVTSKNGATRYFAYGSEHDGPKGAFSGRLCQREYNQDKAIYKGKSDNPELLKAKITVSPPNGMTQEEFDQKVIDVAESFGNDENITYFVVPIDETQGNCNTSTSTILFKAGVPMDKIKEIENSIPGADAGFGNIKPWTATEQAEAVKKQQTYQSILNETLEQSLK